MGKKEKDFEFGKRLKTLISEAGLNNKRVANAIGVSAAAIGNYIEGRIPEAPILLKLSRLLKKSIEELLAGEGPHIAKNKRVFKYLHFTLEDPDPSLTPAGVMNFYSSIYPELSQADIMGPIDRDGIVEYVFEKTRGVKGGGSSEYVKEREYIEKLKYILRGGTRRDRGEVRGIIDEIFEELKKQSKKEDSTPMEIFTDSIKESKSK